MSPTALKLSISGSKIPVQEEFTSCKKNYRRGPAAMMRGSNMGIRPYWLDILFITWGLLLCKAGYLFFISCVVTRSGFALGQSPVYPLRSLHRRSTKSVGD